MRSGNEAVVDYYQGAYGPTLRIDVVTEADLKKLRSVLGEFGSGVRIAGELVHELSAATESVGRIELRAAVGGREQALKLLEHAPRGAAFEWCLEPEAWLGCAQKVDALLVCGRPGHQYLTTEGVDDALVEVCYLERPAAA